MFKKRRDGIMIDVVNREQYACDRILPGKSGPVKGELLKPYYRHYLKKHSSPLVQGGLSVFLGKLPDKFKEQDLEYNLVFLKHKRWCHYSGFYNLETNRWNLLDMGFYFDTLNHKSDTDTLINPQERFLIQNKILKFVIPFPKNKSEYSLKDLKPLLDSLNITDFNISKITIRAFSSVEGNEKRNQELERERAQSIANALQTYQKPTIQTEITTSENWVEFLNDIQVTPYANLILLSKDEIKEKLNDKKTLQDLEPILQAHRKAIILLELQKKDRFDSIPDTILLHLFKNSVKQNKLNQAFAIQQSLFEKIKDHKLPETYISQLEIPRKSEFSLLLSNNSIFEYLLNESEILQTYMELQDLKDLAPNNGPIKYNLCALALKIWVLGEGSIQPKELKKNIQELRKYGIPENLIRRMLINYEIINSEYLMKKNEYSEKDKSLNFIYTNYKTILNSDSDFLNLARYFSSYARYDWAVKLLERRIKNVDVAEDLIFYYINLTIMDYKKTSNPDYRAILQNAYNHNPVRFCRLFNSKSQGGITFQLLDNEYLRKNFCENCGIRTDKIVENKENNPELSSGLNQN